MTETNFVSEEDFEKLLDSIPIQSGNDKMSNEDWRMFFTLMYGCALRIKETTKLKPENLDIEHRILTIPESKTGYKHCKCSAWKAPENSKRNTILVSADKACKRCEGKGKHRVSQRTTILPQDIKQLKSYLYKKIEGQYIWPITRQTAWTKFKQMCEDSKLSYFWQKEERAFKQGWPYLLRSSRAKIMEKMGAEYSLIALKLRHKSTMVTLRYTEQDINALLGWEAQHYKVKVKA